MNEQRQNVEDPSRKAETLGEGVVLDAICKQGGMLGYDRATTLEVMRNNPKYTISQEARLIDSRFGPLIEAAEAVIRSSEVVADSGGMYVLGVSVDDAAALKAAIAKAKGGAQ